MKWIDTGGLPFSRLMDEDYYFVDKSMLIADLLDRDPRGVYMFTRPRRFGKTTNLSMLDAFLNMEYEGNTWFDGLEISKHREFDRYRNAFPVIWLDMSNIFAHSMDSFLQSFALLIMRAMAQFPEFAGDMGTLSIEQRNTVHRINEMRFTREDLVRSVRMLCDVLARSRGRYVVVLIDEYDHAITDTFGTDLHDQIIEFLGRFMSVTLKGNKSLQMGYVTGITDVVFGDMFGGLNNISVNDVFSKRSGERFGFIEDEVRELLEHYGHPERFEEVMGLYGGYRFGDADVCSPFGVTSYVARKCETKSYWADSSGVNPLLWMVERADRDTAGEALRILSGGTVDASIRINMAFDDLDELRGDDLYSLMVVTGYLRAVPQGDGLCSVSVPNRDVMMSADRFIRRKEIIGDYWRRMLSEAVASGDASRVASVLEEALSGEHRPDSRDRWSCVSAVIDLLHAVLPGYEVRSKDGRFTGQPIVLMPRRDGTPAIVVWLTASREGADLDGDADAALMRMRDDKRYSEVQGDVVLAGIAFRAEVVSVRTEILHLGE